MNDGRAQDLVLSRGEGAVVSEAEVERTLKLLDAIAQDGLTVSQRDLSERLGIALGLVNSYLKRLARKGYIKVTTLPRNRLKYLLTPKGIAEKTRLTYEYAYCSYRLYRATRQRCRELLARLAEEGHTEVVLYGTGDVAEIAYLSLQESGLKLAAVVDGRSRGKKFFGFSVLPLSELKQVSYDRLIVASVGPREEAEVELRRVGVKAERVCWLGEGASSLALKA
jgi:DNA-binding MarR family transcriptional regulator